MEETTMNQPSNVCTIFFETCSLYYERIWAVFFFASFLFLSQFLGDFFVNLIYLISNSIGSGGIVVSDLFIFIFIKIFTSLINIFITIALFILALDPYISTIGALFLGFKKIIPYFYAGILYIFIAITGSAFFILPGIYLMFTLSFFGCIIIAENRSGMNALLASRLYVQGYWWSTYLKLFLLSLTTIPFTFLVNALYPFAELYGQNYLIITDIMFKAIVSFAIPFYLFYIATLYEDLREVKGEVDTDSCNKYFWWFMALGAPLFFLLFLGFFNKFINLY